MAVRSPQDLTLSEIIYTRGSNEWQPPDLLSRTGLTALRLRQCCGNDYIPPAEPSDRYRHREELPATRLAGGEYLRNLQELSLVNFRFAEIPPVLSAATALSTLTLTNKATRFMAYVEPKGPFSARQAAEVLARLPRLRELCLAARDWEPAELSSLMSGVLSGVRIVAQPDNRIYVRAFPDGIVPDNDAGFG